jgi:aspartyl-tRNA(Asn)/glutamyl-tRNA(Gln) amidotransferase subunit B
MEVLRVLNEIGVSITDFGVKPVVLAELVKKVEDKDLSSTVAKDILDLLVRDGCSLEDAIKRSGASSARLTGESLDGLISAVMEANADVVGVIKSGQDKKGGKTKFLHGLIMKESRGQADPKEAAEALSRRLGL